MKSLPTIKVFHNKFNRVVIINERDFDPDMHRLPEEPKNEPLGIVEANETNPATEAEVEAFMRDVYEEDELVAQANRMNVDPDYFMADPEELKALAVAKYGFDKEAIAEKDHIELVQLMTECDTVNDMDDQIEEETAEIIEECDAEGILVEVGSLEIDEED